MCGGGKGRQRPHHPAALSISLFHWCSPSDTPGGSHSFSLTTLKGRLGGVPVTSPSPPPEPPLLCRDLNPALPPEPSLEIPWGEGLFLWPWPQRKRPRRLGRADCRVHSVPSSPHQPKGRPADFLCLWPPGSPLVTDHQAQPPLPCTLQNKALESVRQNASPQLGKGGKVSFLWLHSSSPLPSPAPLLSPPPRAWLLPPSSSCTFQTLLPVCAMPAWSPPARPTPLPILILSLIQRADRQARS